MSENTKDNHPMCAKHLLSKRVCFDLFYGEKNIDQAQKINRRNKRQVNRDHENI